MKKNNAFLAILFCLFRFNIAAQNPYVVSNTNLTGPGSISQAINDACAFVATTSAVYNLVIDINLASPGFINLTTNLPLITVPANCNLTIIGNSNNNFLGFKPTVLYAVNRGLQITTNWAHTAVIGGEVTLQNLEFHDFGLYQILSGPPPPAQYSCDFPICVEATNVKKLTINDCAFKKHATAIELNCNTIGDINITNCIFDFYNLGFAGSGCSNTTTDDEAAIYIHGSYNAIPSNYTTQDQINIINNTFSSSSPGNMAGGTAIKISPMEWKFSFGTIHSIWMNLSTYDVRKKINIIDNDIQYIASGIVLGYVPPLRNAPDNTYEVKMDLNTVTSVNAITIYSPYSHFEFTNNVINTVGITGVSLRLGGGGFSGYFNPNPSVYIITNYLQGNKLGFDLIGPNTMGLAVKNTGNSFSHSYSGPGSGRAFILTNGQFDDHSATGDGVRIIGQNYDGFFAVSTGTSTTLRENLCKNMNSTYYTGFPRNPIHFYNFGSSAILANDDISAPVLQDAYYSASGNLIKVAVDITGPTINNTRGPFVLEFFESNANGDLVSFIGRQAIPVLTNSTYTIGIPVPSNLNPAQPLKIGATLTSLGTNSNPRRPMGTSPVGYIDLEPCPDCLGEFAPTPGKKYVVSAWTKIKNVQGLTSYNNSGYSTPIIKITPYSTYNSISQVVMTSQIAEFRPSGKIIDGWQKIEGEYFIPTTAKGLKIEATADAITAANTTLGFGESCLFDDIRFYPADGSMKSYTYDSNTMRLSAELDENNYATIYEYDEEGKLVRLKKETERGIMTIKESKNGKPVR